MVTSQRPPRQFEEYRLERLLGEGESGEVWAALDTRLERAVAIKFLQRGALDPRRRERFTMEARALARLRHPHVVGIHRAGEVDGRPYLVSELVEGRDLSTVPRPQPPETVLRFALTLSDALAAAHRMGVLHRDIKPANVMLTPAGDLRLLDFGLAKLAGGDDATAGSGASPPGVPVSPLRMTRTGALVGTPLYLAPELWAEQPATPRSDLYSLGVVLYELLAGRPPFVATTLDELHRAVTRDEAPPLPAELGVPGALAAIVARCLRRDPAERFPSAEALHHALLEAAPRPAPPVRPSTPSRAAALLVALLLVAAVVVVAVRARTPEQPRARPAPSAASSAMAAVARPPWLRPSLAVLEVRDRSGRAGHAGHSNSPWTGPALASLLEWSLAADGGVRVVSGLQLSRMRRELAGALPGGSDALTGELSGEVAERARRYLGVDAIVQGAYAVDAADQGAPPESATLRLSLRLVDERARVVEVDGRLGDVLSLGARAADAVRGATGAPPVEPARREALRAALPVDLETLQLLAEGTWLAGELDVAAARRVLERAVERSPRSPMVRVQLALACERLGQVACLREEMERYRALSASLSDEARLRSEAHNALAQGDREGAARRHAELVRRLPDSIEDGLLASQHLAETGHLPEALALNDRLRALPAPVGNDPRVDMQADLQYRSVGRAAEALAAARRSGELARARGNRHIAGRARSVEAYALLDGARLAEAESAFLEALPMLQAVGEHDEEMWALDGLARVRLRRGAVSAAIGSCREVLAKNAPFHHQQLQMFMLASCATPHRVNGQLARARELCEQALGICREGRVVECPASAVASSVITYTLAGDLRAARALVRSAGLEALASQATDSAARVGLVVGDLLRAEGALPEARRVVEHAVEVAERVAAPRMANQGRLLLATIELAGGHPERAAELAELAARAYAAEGSVDDELVARSTWASARAATLDPESIRSARVALLAFAERGRRSESLLARAAFALATARLGSRALPPPPVAELAATRAALAAILDELTAAGYRPLAGEARLALLALDAPNRHGPGDPRIDRR